MTGKIWAGTVAVVVSSVVGGPNVQQARLDLIRPAGARAYELIVVEEGAQLQRTRTRFVLHTDSPTSEWFEIVGAWLQRGSSAEEPITLDVACRREFGATEATLGRVRLSIASTDLTTLAPLCVPEPLFGAVTDILTFLLIQVPEHHGIEQLQSVGQSADVAGFTTTWSRPPQLLAARFVSPGGSIKVAAVANDRALLRFSPGSAQLDVLRALGPGNRGLLTGIERIELEIDVDARTGELTGGRSVVDELTMRLFMNYAGERLPEPREAPSSGGVPVTVKRTLHLSAVR